MIISRTSQVDLDFSDYRISSALVTGLIVGIVSVNVGVMSVRIISVIWIRIVKEWVTKIAEENDVVEATMTEPITAKVTVATKAATVKVTPIKAAAKSATVKSTAEPATVEATAKLAAAAKAGSTGAGAITGKSSAAVSLRQCVRGCKNANRETNCDGSNVLVVHNVPVSLHFSFH